MTHANQFVGFAPIAGAGMLGATSTNSGSSWGASSPANLGSYAGEASSAYDTSHNLYYGYLVADGVGGTQVRVSKLANGSTTWGPPAAAEGSVNLPDKPMLVIDSSSGAAYSHTNRLYLAYDEQKSTTSQPVVVAHSDDGTTWAAGAKVQLYDSGGDTAPVEAVGPNGELYVLWDDFKTASGRLLLEKSTDGGASFTALGASPVVVASTGIGFGATLTNYGKGNCPGGVRPVGPSVALAVDRSGGARNGWLYAVWADKPAGATQMHIYFGYSSNGGQAWSSPTTVDFDNGKDAWGPSIAVDQSNGKVAVAWYDRRDDPGNKLYLPYYAQSFTGTSFPAQIPVATAQSDPTLDCNGTGAATSLLAVDGKAYPFWSDTRGGADQIYTAQINPPFGLGTVWQSIPGSAHDIAVSVGANGSVWAIGTNAVSGGYGIWHWTGSGWISEPGGALHIAVDPNGNPWVTNSSHQIYFWVSGGWQSEPGSANDVAVGADGIVDIISNTSASGGYQVQQWTGSSWTNLGNGAAGTRIAVDNSGLAFVVNSLNELWEEYPSVSYSRISTSANDVGSGADGSVWIVTNTAASAGYTLALWYGGANWQSPDGSGTDISVGPNGAPWITQSTNQIWERT